MFSPQPLLAKSRLKLQILTGKDTSATAQSIAEDVSRLPDFVYEDQLRALLARFCLSPQLQHASPDQLDAVIDKLADQMKRSLRAFLYW